VSPDRNTTASLLVAILLGVHSLHVRGDVVVLVLGLDDSNAVGHDLLVVVGTDLNTLHDLDLKAEDTLAELDVADSDVDEFPLRLTSGDLVTLSVLLCLCALATHLTRDDDLAAGGTTTAHHSAHDVVGGHTDGGAVKQLELEGLNVSGGGQVLVVGEGLDGELDFVILVVEVVALLDQRLDLLHLTGLGVEEGNVVGSADTDLSAHVGNTDLNAGVAVHTEGASKELVELSLEDTVSDELLLGVDSSDLLVCHLK